MFAEDWAYASNDNKTIVKLLRNAKKPQLMSPEQIETALKADPPIKVRAMQLIPAGPDNEYAPILRTIIAAMHKSQKHIYLTTPYLIPDNAALIALTSAAKRGVDVKILVPKDSDSFIVEQASLSWFEDLVAAGIEIYEYLPHMLHTKTIIIDDNLSFIGTSNFDYRSFYLNFELALMSFAKDLNKDLTEEFFERVKVSEKVKIVKLPLHKRLLMSAARLFSPLL